MLVTSVILGWLGWCGAKGHNAFISRDQKSSMMEGMDLVDVSQRLVGLRQEIRDLQDMNSQYQDRESHSHTDNSAQEQRRLRLVQIKDELADMKRRQARHWKG
jgi:hypothetical protein